MATYSKYPNLQRAYDNTSYFDKNIRCLSERQVRWLQAYLASNTNVSFSHVGATDRHQELIDRLVHHDNFKELVTESYSKMSHSLVPEQHFEWLSDNLRAQIFALHILSSEHRYNTLDPSNHDLMNEIYWFFDDKNNTLHVDGKIGQLNNIEQRWYMVFEKDNYSKWLTETSKEQIEWTREYLKKDGIYNHLGRNASSPKEIISHVLASLDLIDFPLRDQNIENYVQTDRKERIIDKMKRAWSQQKYRDAGKTKKPYHLPLTKIANARLDKMASVKGTTSTAILDMLINSAYEEDYIDEQGNDKYQSSCSLY